MSASSVWESITGLGVLGIISVTAKLIGLVDWSWWATLIPFYAGPAACVVIFVCYVVCVAWREVLNAVKELAK